MPPKGWRKNNEGRNPVSRDQDLVSIDDILFPRATIQKLTKNITANDSLILSKDALLAIQRLATVFVNHVLHHSKAVAVASERRTVNAQDVLNALQRAQLGGFVPDVKHKLTQYEAEAEEKKRAKAAGNEPALKKLKDSDLQPVVDVESEAEDETREEEAREDSVEEEADDAPEESAPNPIAALGKEEQELGGDTQETQDEASSDDE